MISSPLEAESLSAFDDFIERMGLRVFRGAIAYLALLESEELQLSLPIALALADRVPTGPLYAFDVNARTDGERVMLLIAEGGSEDVKRRFHDPDFGLEDIIYHKVGVTSPVWGRFGTPLESINIGGSRCPVCQTIDKVAQPRRKKSKPSSNATAIASLLRNYLKFSLFAFHLAYTYMPEMFDGILGTGWTWKEISLESAIARRSVMKDFEKRSEQDESN